MAKSLHFEVTGPVNHDGDREPRVHVQFYSITDDVKRLGAVQHVLQSEWPKYRGYLGSKAGGANAPKVRGGSNTDIGCGAVQNTSNGGLHSRASGA